MKKVTFLGLVIAITITIVSCNFFGNNDEPLDPNELNCYVAVDQKDSAWLSIDTTEKGTRVRGTLKMKYANGKFYDGQFEGAFKGDTLKGHYDFKENAIDKWHRNPVAFLERDGKLMMGVGNFTLIWGSPHFDANKPIDFEKGRFVFKIAQCPN